MKRRNRERRLPSAERLGTGTAGADEACLDAFSPSLPREVAIVCWIGVVLAFAWAYWPTLQSLVAAWDRQPDYSHGYFVAPLAAYFLWARRKDCPGLGGRFAWVGALLIVLSIGLRFLAARYYIEALDGWSMMVWAAGVVGLVGGVRLLAWAWPAVAFLFFMVPLPWNAERLFSLPLQRVATHASTWVLQCLGQPAIAEGTTVWMGSQQLEIERACSGLRIFVAVAALVCVYLILFDRPWWKRALLVLSVGPIAIIANVLRIVLTGLLGCYVESESVREWGHDILGWIMTPIAALLFGLVLWYLDRLVREVKTADIRSIISREGRLDFPAACGENSATGVLE